MPELPEVETIRSLLHHDLINKIIANVTVREAKQFVGDKKEIINQTIVEILRKGKVISLKLSNNKYISIHLKLTGQLLFSHDKTHATFKNQIPLAYTNTMPGKTTSVIIYFTDGSVLFFNDLRKFGWVRIGVEANGPKSVDVLSADFKEEYLQKIIRKTRKPIKVLLMDQEVLAGIGNIYANDSLNVAKIHPQRKANTLTPTEVHELFKAIKTIIAKGIRQKGSSARDEIYILPDGSKGAYQNYFKVYHRENLPCLLCKTPIIRIKQAGRSSFFCPKCQIE